jgi:hypothetical protein
MSTLTESLPFEQQAAMMQELAQSKQQLAHQQQFIEQAKIEINRLNSLAASSSSTPHIGTSSSSSSSTSIVHNSPRSISSRGLSVKPLAPSSFSGQTGNNAIQWLTEIERCFSVTDTDLHTSNCVLLASTYLKDAASVWFTSKYPTMNDTPSNWQVFREAFLDRFRPFAAERIARAQLRDLRHRSNVTGYSDAFLKLVQHIPSMHVSDQIDAYMHGLQAHIAAEVDRLDPQSLSEAINAAQKEELRQASKKGQRLPFYSTQQRRNIVPHTYHASSAPDPNRMDLSHLQHANPLMFSPSVPPTYSQYLNAIGAATPNMNNHNVQSSFGVTPYSDNELAYQQQYNEYVHNSQLHLNAMYQRPSSSYRHAVPPLRNSANRSFHSAPEMSKEEYERCVKNRLCFRCKKSDHTSRFCPSGSNSSSQSRQPLN